MRLEWDEDKRRSNLEKHGLDFADAAHVFIEEYYQIEDLREDYGETRYRVWGFLNKKRIALVWTPRGGARRMIMMRYAHEQEHETHIRALD
jgi:uncharacterized DUF497 family protein